MVEKLFVWVIIGEGSIVLGRPGFRGAFFVSYFIFICNMIIFF